MDEIQEIANEIFVDSFPRLQSLTVHETEEVFEKVMYIIKSNIKSGLCSPNEVKVYQD